MKLFSVAKEAGFIISSEDLNSLRAELELLESNDGELTDEQLEAVAGGAAFFGGLAASTGFMVAGVSGVFIKTRTNMMDLIRRRNRG
jgi:hypothetical protein